MPFMCRRFHNAIVAVLVFALLLLGLQSAGIAATGPMETNLAPASVSTTMEMADHDCENAEARDCCTLQDCQVSSHCSSHTATALTSLVGAPACERRNTDDLAAPNVIVASILVLSIYRPPWA